MKKEIKLVKLMYGEEVIGTVASVGEAGIRLKDVIRLIVMPGNAATKQAPSIGFADYVPWVKEKDFFFKDDHVMHVLEPNEEIQREYRKMFSNLDIPSGGNLILGLDGKPVTSGGNKGGLPGLGG
jgi:hypothetical protein